MITNKTNNSSSLLTKFSRKKKKKVLFVGSFVRETTDGRNGGQMFACNSLLSSRLGKDIEWVLVDSTAKLPLRPVGIRALLAGKRVLLCCFHLLTKRIDTTLVFTGHGVSLMEKGLIVFLSRLTGRQTVIAPRSGFIVNDITKPIMRKYIQIVFKSASIVVCQSSHWQSVFLEVAPTATTTIIHNWIVPLNLYNKKKKQVGEPIRILFLGWVTSDKGIFELVEAIRTLSQKRKLVLSVCGHGDSFDAVEKYIAQYRLENTIEMKGWVKQSEKLEELARADIFVQPTHFEGFPNALLEAMSAGVPSICSNIPAISSLVKDKQHCLLFEAGNVNSLASAIDTLSASTTLRNNLSVNARNLIQSQFSIEYGVEAFENIL